MALECRHETFSIIVLLSSQCNDRRPWPYALVSHLAKDVVLPKLTKGQYRDEASTGAARQEKETTTILNRCKKDWLRKRVSDGRDNICSGIIFEPTLFNKKNM
jgi:hypothetical protein